MSTPEERRLLDEETEASEATRDEPLSEGAVRHRPHRTEVYSVRLTSDEVRQIQRIADEAGVPTSGLVRDWVRQGMAAERGDSVSSTVEALERDVDRLKRQLIEA